jgi:ribose-phosphate pyrophosphokinase
MASLLEAAGADRVLSMDLHQGQIQGFFEIPVDHMTAVPMLADYFRFKEFGGTPLVAVSADAGGVKLAKRFANRVDGDLAVLTKMRPEHNRAEAMHFIGDVKGKIAIVVDDMIDTAGSITSAVDTLCENGAKEVYVTATHGIFSDPARHRRSRRSWSPTRSASSLALTTVRSRSFRWPTSWPTPSRTCSRTSR